MIELDGSSGEGGGQILRSALTLSMITGQAFRLTKIRAKRSKPGLLRQHLVAIQAAAQICGADVAEIGLGAQELLFRPGKIKGGRYQFAIGSAGSCNLVLQTILPALLFADQVSEVHISGGTHNAMAPPFQFLQRAYAPILAKMGAQLELELLRFGFYPAGGGEVIARVAPCSKLTPLDLIEAGTRTANYCESFIAAVPFRVAERELACVGQAMAWEGEQLLVRELPAKHGPGNALLLTLEHTEVNEVFCAFGEKAVSSEQVADKLIKQVRAYLASGAAMGEYLADQVMLPFALAGAGSFSCSTVSQHSLTNAMVIERFLPVQFAFSKDGRRHVCHISKLL